MKNLISLIVLIFLLLALLVSISAYLGRDLLINLKRLTNSEQLTFGKSDKNILVKFAVISDTHSDSLYTAKAVEQAKEKGAEYIIHTGDWTTVGTINELNEQKEIFAKSNLSYWGILGDHDRWQSGSKNFETVFGTPYESFDKEGIHHVLLDSSDLQEGLGETQLDWLENDLKQNKEKQIIIFMHLPPYHPTSDRTIDNKGGNSREKSDQVRRFFDLIKDQKVIAIFSGDHHLSSNYTEPQTSVRIFISGAVTKERNLQTPRFSFVEIYEDFSLAVEDQVI